MFAALALVIAAIGQPAGPRPVEPETHYAAFWLTDLKGSTAHPKLLVAKRPFPEMVKNVNLFERAEVPLFERWGLMMATYKKAEIWNPDLRPIKPLTRFGFLNEKERTVEANGVLYRYDECPLGEVVRLLKGQAKEEIARINSPLAGMEETARALRLLLEAELKERGAKKK